MNKCIGEGGRHGTPGSDARDVRIYRDGTRYRVVHRWGSNQGYIEWHGTETLGEASSLDAAIREALSADDLTDTIRGYIREAASDAHATLAKRAADARRRRTPIARLIERRARLVAQIADIDARLASVREVRA